MSEEKGTTARMVIADSKVDLNGDLIKGTAVRHQASSSVRGIRQHERSSAAFGAGAIQVSGDGNLAWVDMEFAPTAAGEDMKREIEFLESKGIKYAPSVGASYNSKDVRLPGQMTEAERATGALRVIDKITVREVSSVDMSALPGHTVDLNRAEGATSVERSDVVYYLEREDKEVTEEAPQKSETETKEENSLTSEDVERKIAMAVAQARAEDALERAGRFTNG